MNSVNKNQISDPGYAMELIAHVQQRYPGVDFHRLDAMTDIPCTRLIRLNSGKGQMKYPEQVVLESLLDPETVATLRSTWCNTHKPTFWERHLSGE